MDGLRRDAAPEKSGAPDQGRGPLLRAPNWLQKLLVELRDLMNGARQVGNAVYDDVGACRS